MFVKSFFFLIKYLRECIGAMQHCWIQCKTEKRIASYGDWFFIVYINYYIFRETIRSKVDYYYLQKQANILLVIIHFYFRLLHLLHLILDFYFIPRINVTQLNIF